MRFLPNFPLRWVLLWVGMVGVAGCDRSSEQAADQQRSQRVALHVFAASSLREALEQLASQFEAQHRGVEIALNFSGSQVLRLQLAQGATADVFVSANRAHLQALREAGLVEAEVPVVDNELAVVVPRRAAQPVERFEQLAEVSRLIVGSPEVPIGIYTRQLFDKARASLGEPFVRKLQRAIVSEESNVRLVRAKVELGQADAAIVYRSDALGSAKVSMVDIAPELNCPVTYWASVVRGSARPELSAQWVAFLRSGPGQAVFAARGFQPRPTP